MGAETIILAPFLLLALGAFLRHTASSLPIPYTVQLLICGGALGFFLRDSDGSISSSSSSSSSWDGPLQQSLQALADMDPHLMLHVFLPPLIFESAASLEWHLFTREKWYIFALAGPGLMISSILTAAVLQWVLGGSSDAGAFAGAGCPNDAWTLSAGLLLGVVISATDPVAVVSLLKHQLGTSSSLSTAIEGESLLNDGTALVMFSILLNIVKRTNDEGWDDYIWTFIRATGGGALLGTGVAAVTVKWLGIIFADSHSEITITLCLAYLTFYVAESVQMSGVIACTAAGLYFGVKGRISVSPDVSVFLESFWEFMAFIGNTLVFIIAGCVIGSKMPVMALYDYVRLAIVYGACTAIRAVVVLSTFAVFKLAGSPLVLRDQFVGIWAGVRGAVGLSLAMMVFGETSMCQPYRSQIMFYTAGIVVLTVLINSSTMPWLLRLLRMHCVAPSMQLIHDQAIATLVRVAKKQEQSLRADAVYDSCVWSEARRYFYEPETTIRRRRRLHHRRSTITSENERGGDGSMQYVDAKEARRRVLMIVKKSYWRQYKDGFLSRSSLQLMLHTTNVALENDCSLTEWKTFAAKIELSSTIAQHDEASVKALAKLSKSQLQKRRMRAALDSIPSLFFVLVLVGLSCSTPFFPNTVPFRVVEHITTAAFLVELCLRLYSLDSWHAIATDLYLVVDAFVVIVDIVLLGAGDILGGAAQYVAVGRTVRFLKLVRLLRIGRVIDRLRKAKVAAVEEREHLIFGQHGSLIKRYQRRILYNQLQHGYEVANTFKHAREEALSGLRRIDSNALGMDEIRKSLEKDIRSVRSSLLELLRLYPEVASSITTAVAARTVLNCQRQKLDELQGEGLLDETESEKLRDSVDSHMKRLINSPPLIMVPKKEEILAQLTWLQCLSSGEMRQITAAFEEGVFKSGDVLVRQGEADDRVHILARGTVKVLYDKSSGERIEVDELGIGSVFGEISFLLSHRRGASIVASSSGLVYTIDGQALRRFCKVNLQLEERLWQSCGRRLAENLLAAKLESRLSRREVRNIVDDMTITHIHRNGITSALFRPGLDRPIVLLTGRGSFSCESTGRTEIVEGPAILDPKPTHLRGDGVLEVEFSEGSKFMCHPEAKASVQRSRNIGESCEHDNGRASINATISESMPPSSCRELAVYAGGSGDERGAVVDEAREQELSRRRSSLLELEFKSSSAYSTLSTLTRVGEEESGTQRRQSSRPRGVDRNSANLCATGDDEVIAHLRSPESSRSSEAESSMSDPTGMV